jgi:hypothetical protein
MAYLYGVGMHLEDIESEVKDKLWRQMLEVDTGGPFAKDTPKEAADFFLEKTNFRIREWARLSARKEADERKKQSGQADDLADVCWPKKQARQADEIANVRQRDLPPDVETELFAIAKSLPRITSATPNLTPRDSDIVRKEVLRQAGIDDLPAPIFDQVAQAAGISSSELRAHVENHDEHGHLSPSDRKAWSRARGKIAKALTRAALTSLLAVVFALSVALLNATHQGRLSHQNDFVNQGSLIEEKASTHQRSLTDEVASTHQRNLTDEVASTHQRNLIDPIARDHQGNLL